MRKNKNIKCKECGSIVKPNDNNTIIYKDYTGFICSCGNTILDYEVNNSIINKILYEQQD